MTAYSDRTRQSLEFEIAGLKTLVKSNSFDLIEAVKKRYSSFASEGEALLEVEIDYVGQARASSLLDTGTGFKDGVCIFSAPGYEGYIDTGRGVGELTLSSKRPVEEVDYYLRVAYALLAFDNGGLMFHAAGIVRNGNAYLFFGHSGAGKTTVARVSKDAIVLNDDLLLLMPWSKKEADGSRWIAYATPFWNPTQVQPTRQRAPVVGIYRLVQDLEVYLEPIGRGQALAELVSNVPVIPDDPGRGGLLLQRSANLLEDVPAQKLHFLPDDSFWSIVETMGEPNEAV